MAIDAIHPGEHVQEELDALGVSEREMAANLGVQPEPFAAVVRGEADLDADLALRLAHFFGTSAQFWLNLLSLYELRLAEQRLGETVNALPTLKQLQAA